MSKKHPKEENVPRPGPPPAPLKSQLQIQKEQKERWAPFATPKGKLRTHMVIEFADIYAYENGLCEIIETIEIWGKVQSTVTEMEVVNEKIK